VNGEALIGPVTAPDLHLMTFNVRRPMPRPQWRAADRWSRRRRLVATLLASELPTVLGVQETVPDQASTILTALGPSYRYVGKGHGVAGRGEGCPIFFDTDRLELLGWQQQALSDEPDTAGSTSWGNRVPRVVVSAEFRDRETSATFIVLNTHLDHLSFASRRRSAEEIRRRVSRESRPAVVMGDFNAGTGSAAYSVLFGGGALLDAWGAASARSTPEWGTFAGYRSPRTRGRRIDWIAVSPEVEVQRAAINARRFDAGWPSDHLPVQAVVRLPASR
jgi:endonuclease/exonuclease/phosphatase family metal-dependent hydrolase